MFLFRVAKVQTEDCKEWKKSLVAQLKEVYRQAWFRFVWGIFFPVFFSQENMSFIYFLSDPTGGRDLKGTRANPKNLRTAPQSRDQTLTRGNLALTRNIEFNRPVRVIRGYKLDSPYAPEDGYRYDGKLTSYTVCMYANLQADFLNLTHIHKLTSLHLVHIYKV